MLNPLGDASRAEGFDRRLEIVGGQEDVGARLERRERQLRRVGQRDRAHVEAVGQDDAVVAELPAQDRLARTAPPSLKERCDFYLGVVAKAGRWLTAKEIDPSNRFCGRGLKYWTLRRMAKHGQLKTYCDGKTIYFNLPNKEHAK